MAEQQSPRPCGYAHRGPGSRLGPSRPYYERAAFDAGTRFGEGSARKPPWIRRGVQLRLSGTRKDGPGWKNAIGGAQGGGCPQGQRGRFYDGADQDVAPIGARSLSCEGTRQQGSGPRASSPITGADE